MGPLATIQAHLTEVRAELAGLAPTTLSESDVTALVRLGVELERLGAALRTRYAKRVADTRAFETTGHHDAANWLAGVSGESTGAAKGVLTLADKLAQVPLVDQAFSNGRLSAAQATVVAGAGALDPSSQEHLIERAEQASFRELKEAAARVTRRALGEASELAKERRAHEQRFLRFTPTAHGGVRLSGRLTRLDGARVASVLDAERQQVVNDARTAGHRTRDEAHLADALVRVVCGDPATRPRAQVTVQADLAALKRGSVEGDEVCEIPGIGSIPVAVAQDLLGDAWVELVLRQGTDVTTITSKKRTIPTAVRTALWA
ncbi:MAG TPA: hypothetical protein VHB02_03175, partial [Acidimicrobiales bacterium]|nr:hypothetical protein [Acidimicrobiales bacterium]